MNMQDRLAQIMLKKRGFTEEVLKENQKILEDLMLKPVLDNTIALIESHKQHGIIYPSMIHYFLKMGYNVHLFSRYEHKNDNSIALAKFDNVRFTQTAFPIIPESYNFFEYLTLYKYVWVNTIFTHDGYNFANALNTGFIQKYNKNNVFFIDHDFVSIQKDIDTIEQKLIKEKRIFVLRDGIEIQGKKMPFVSPTWFGKYDRPIKEGKIHFLAVGGGYQDNLRNVKLLFETIEELIKGGITNFDVTFIGITEKRLAYYVNDNNKQYINFLGIVTYEELFKQIQKSHFLLFNIDNTCNEYDKYLNKGITGSYLLTLGFAKPSIIYKELANNYGLSKCAITYQKDLFTAMNNAINMKSLTYENLQKVLIEKNKMLQQKSLENLKQILYN